MISVHFYWILALKFALLFISKTKFFHFIDDLRHFIRPSGTEDVVRIYAEAETKVKYL